MLAHSEGATGRSRTLVLVVLALIAIALYLYSERAAPPDPEPAGSRPDVEAPSADPRPVGDAAPATVAFPAASRPGGEADETSRRSENIETQGAADEGAAAQSGPPAVPLAESGSRLRVALAERLTAGQLDLVVSQQLIERLVATIHSLDGEPVPLRFRPLAHVADLPRVESRGDESLRLPETPDPRYGRYRDLFDRLDASTLAALYELHEAAFDAAWRALGESPQPSFRQRLVEVLEHLAAFELPAQRPRLVRPEVLYEFADPSLEALSWGRKILIRVGPDHAEAIRRKARSLADALAPES